MFQALSLVAAPLTEWLKGRAERARVKEEGKIRLAEARVRAEELRTERMANIEADYDLEALRQQKFSLKDEFLLIVVVAPFIGSFIPGIQDYVMKGWEYVEKAPIWYTVSFTGIIAAVFGLRWWFSKNAKQLRVTKQEKQL